MNAPVIACLSEAELKALVLRPLQNAEAEELARHLERCPDCSRRAEGILRGDCMEAAMRETAAGLDTTAVPGAGDLVERLKKMVVPRPGASSKISEGDTQCWAPEEGKESLDFLAPAQGPDELGRLGSYRLLSKLGAGGMGIVFLAEDVLLNRMVALKLMLPQYASKAGAKERFLREARAAASIDHDRIVPIFQVGEDRGTPFLAMKFLRGEPLDARLEREGKLPIAEAMAIARGMAEGLAAAHANHLIHRDIKPSNVWLEFQADAGDAGPPRVRLLDFGLARAVDDNSQLTQAGLIVGTPAFMAPEQARGEQVDGRADLFSLGCVLYAMLTGRAPFSGNNTLSLLTALAVETPQQPSILNFDVPTELSDLTMRLLAKDAGDRPQTARAVVEALAVLQAPASPPTPAPVVMPAVAVPPSRRRRGVLIAVGLLFLAGIGIAVGQVVIIRDKNGNKVAEIQVPEGGRVEVVSSVKSAEAKNASLPDNRANAKSPLPVSRGKYALAFDKQDNVMVSSLQLDNTRPLTLEGYVTPMKHRIKRTYFCTHDGIYLSAARTWGVITDNHVSKEVLYSAIPVRLGQRTHVAVVFTGRRVTLYVDGEVALSQDYEPTNHPSRFHIGGDGSGGALGLIEEVRVSSKARYDKNFTPAARFEPDADTLALYHCDEGAGEAVRDATGHGHHGTIRGASWVKTSDDWATQVAALPPELQVYAVSAKLVERNAGFDGTVKHKINDVAVTELEFLTDNVVDVTPVRALAGLRVLRCAGSNVGKGKLLDLGQLRGMKLVHLDCPANPLFDLSPLKDMPLNWLNVLYTPVSDLSPLKDLPLTALNCSEAKVADLSPLRGMNLKALLCGYNRNLKDLSPLAGMKLTELDCVKTSVTDLSPLKDMPIKTLRCDFVAERDAAILRAIPTLETINDKPAKEVLAAASPSVDDAWVKQVAVLPTSQKAAAVAAKLKELNPGFDGDMVWKDFGSPDVASVDLSGKKISNLSPLRALRELESLACTGSQVADLSPLLGLKLRRLMCEGTPVHDLSPLAGMPLEILKADGAPVADLSPLKGMPLFELGLSRTRVSDLSPLRGMKLRTLAVGETNVADLGPLAGMPLKALRLSGSKVADLKPLHGLPLTTLDCNNNPKIADIAPLEGMPLETLSIGPCPVSDLTPLKGMKLQTLECDTIDASDLSPLAGMPLTRLRLSNTKVSDLSPLKGMPLKELRGNFELDRDGPILRAIPTLEKINGKPAAEFWKEVEAAAKPKS